MSIHVLILTWGHIWVTWRAPGVPVDEQRLCVGGVVIRCAHRGDKMVVALVLEVALQCTDLVRWLVTRIGQRRCKVRYLGWSDHNCLLGGARNQSLPHHLLIWTWLDSVSLDSNNKGVPLDALGFCFESIGGNICYATIAKCLRVSDQTKTLFRLTHHTF